MSTRIANYKNKNRKEFNKNITSLIKEFNKINIIKENEGIMIAALTLDIDNYYAIGIFLKDKTNNKIERFIFDINMYDVFYYIELEMFLNHIEENIKNKNDIEIDILAFKEDNNYTKLN